LYGTYDAISHVLYVMYPVRKEQSTQHKIADSVMNSEVIHSEDEFFGDQTDSDDNYSHHEEIINPESKRPHGALDEHEMNSQSETHRNIGYHEAYDEYKEVQLQEGFEAGYRNYIGDATKLGMLLGKCVSISSGRDRTNKTHNDAGIGSDDDGIIDAVGTVRKYLENAQSTNTNDDDDDNKDTERDKGHEDMQTIIEHLQKKLKAHAQLG